MPENSLVVSATEAPPMARTQKNPLPKYVELNPRNQTYDDKNPAMPGKANLGKEEQEAV